MDPCPYIVGKRACVAGARGHAGRHEWPRHASAEAYIRGIRNADKRAYAIAYLAFLRDSGPALEPDAPGLSYMGAQAVRLALSEAVRA